MNFWVALRNIGAIISFGKAFVGLVEGIAKNKEVPPAEQIADLIQKARVLIEKIDIPNVDEQAISEALKQIEEQLSGK